MRNFFKARGAPRQPTPGVNEHVMSTFTPSSFVAEQYRALRHVLEQMHKTGALTIVGVSSPGVGDGKTTTSINLAASLAEDPDTRVLLADADLRWSTVANYLGLDNRGAPGLAEAIVDPGLTLTDVARPRPPLKVSVVTTGRCRVTPYELLNSPRLGELLEEARQHYDYVVLDTPPLLPVPDCRVLARWVDGFLVVVAANKTPRKLLEESLNILDPAKVVGLVFNGDDRPLAGYYGHYYAYAQPPDFERDDRHRRPTSADPSPGPHASSGPAAAE